MAMMSDNRAVSSAPKSRTLRQVMPAMSIPLASRAFALYCLFACIVGLTVCESYCERARLIFVALALLFVLIFAVPAG